jgi:hypothetical protein
MLGANRATSVAVVHAASRTRATLPAIQFISVRTFADVDIEHGRKEWKILGDLKNYKPGKNVIQTWQKCNQNLQQDFSYWLGTISDRTLRSSSPGRGSPVGARYFAPFAQT